MEETSFTCPICKQQVPINPRKGKAFARYTHFLTHDVNTSFISLEHRNDDAFILKYYEATHRKERKK